MKFKALNKPGNNASEKAIKYHQRFQNLIDEIKNKDLNHNTISALNEQIEKANMALESENSIKDLKKANYRTFKILEKEEKLVAKGHYRNMWMILGMSTFGIPMGLAFSASIDNYGFIALGIPIGMSIGIAIGAGMDKKAKSEGRQLNIELNV